MIPAHEERHRLRPEHCADRVRDLLPDGPGVEGREDDVATIHCGCAIEHGHPMRGVIAVDERAHAPHLEGREPGAGAVGGPAVVRDAQEHGARATG